MTDSADENVLIFDPSALESLEAQVGSDMLPMLLSGFMDEVDGFLIAIEKLDPVADITMIEIKSHGMKSAALSFGAVDFGNHCKAIEECAKQGNSDKTALLLQAIPPKAAAAKAAVGALQD